MNRRRGLQLAISVIVAAHAAPIWAQATASGVRRVGVLAPSTRAKEEITLKLFFDQMREFGWREGQKLRADELIE